MHLTICKTSWRHTKNESYQKSADTNNKAKWQEIPQILPKKAGADKAQTTTRAAWKTAKGERLSTEWKQGPPNTKTPFFESADKLRTEAIAWRLLPFKMVFKYKESIHN